MSLKPIVATMIRMRPIIFEKKLYAVKPPPPWFEDRTVRRNSTKKSKQHIPMVEY